MMLFNSGRLACAFLLAGALGAATHASAAAVALKPLVLPKGVTVGPSVEGITEYRLQNGLKVLLFPDNSKPTITVNVTYLVGSRHENYGETGMAHLLEHLMFKGSPRNRDITRQFAERGMQFNGTTSLDRTNYYEVFQATGDNLQWALQMEADRMTGSFIARRDLDSEMTVVRNEYESGENSPSSVLLKRLQSVAYDWHSYGRSTIGNRSDIENVGIGNLQAFYKTWYQPDNAVLLVAGKFDPHATLAFIAQKFGALARPRRELPKYWTVEPTQDGARSFEVRRQGDVQIVAVAYHVPSALHDDSDVLAFSADILGNGPASRLHKLLIDSGMASQVFSFGQTGYAPGLQVFGAIVKKGDPIDKVAATMTTAIESFAATPPSTDEMERVRRTINNEIDKSLNDPQQVGVALSEAIALGDWRLYFVGRERVATISAQEVAKAADGYLRRDNRVTGYFLPDDATRRAEIPAAPAVASLLANFTPKATSLVSEDFDPSQANIMQRTRLLTIGGVRVALLPKKNRGESVSVELVQHFGDPATLFGKGAVPSLTASMLARGTTRHDRVALTDAFDALRMTGGPHQFETTRSHLAEALRLAAQVLKSPAFSATELEQLRAQTLVAIEANRSEPQAVASRALAEHFNTYPRGDVRYDGTIDDDLADTRAATLDQIKAFHRDFYGAAPAELAIVGDFDADAIIPVIEELFGKWQPLTPVAPVLRRAEVVAPVRRLLDTPDKENGVLVARQNLDLNIDDPDYPALTIANYIFGEGGLKSRLLDRIRQKDGLSYGGGSQLAAGELDRAGAFMISAIAAPPNLARVEQAVQQELARALKDGFTQAELTGAKSGLMQQRLQNRADDAVLAAGWAAYLHRNASFTWSAQFEQRLMAVTLAQLNAAFRKVIDPSKLTVVIAGDVKKATAPTK
ncbi:M16 family metallopeptidase [Massilia sp. DWR3-1-1]|uniref:M16 family metallopeptidase n=1 Tax=Massilia sp. DWR3-1-1 TaxID=2804559 RepID=UPI003CE84387